MKYLKNQGQKIIYVYETGSPYLFIRKFYAGKKLVVEIS